MINLPSDPQVLIQGVTQPSAQAALLDMHSYGMQILAGVSAGAGDQTRQDIKIFDLVEQAIACYPQINTTIIFSPALDVLDAALEAIAAGIKQIIIATSGVPPLDMIKLSRHTTDLSGWVLGSGSAGLIVPNQILLGKLDASMFTPGAVGIISQSHSLIYEVVELLNNAQIGQSLVVHLGSDHIRGSKASRWLSAFSNQTEHLLLLGNMSIDQDLRQALKQVKKIVIAYNPQLQITIAPVTDAARLLRVGQENTDPAQPQSSIKVATNLDQIVQLLPAADRVLISPRPTPPLAKPNKSKS
jgi:succinyl-CoA synthetase alpha subunit